MNKAELVEVVATRIDTSKKDAAEAVQAVVDAITEAVARGQKVSISGFGVFEKAARPARTYHKPSTGEAISKMATQVPRFRPGGDFRALVAGEKALSDAVKAASDVAGEAVRLVTGRKSAPAEKVAEPTPAAAAPAKKAPAKKAPAKTATAAKAPAKKAPAKKAAPAAPAATAPAKKAPAKKAPAKKTTTATATAAKKAPAKRAPAKKAPAASPVEPAAPASDQPTS